MANENETPPVISKPFSFQLRNTSIHECDDVRRCLWRHIWRPLLHQDPTSGVVGKTMEHRINWQFQWLWLGKVQKLRISAWIENTRPTLLRQYGMKATIRVQTLHFSNTEIEYAFLNINQYKQKQSNTFYFNLFIPEQRRPKIPMTWQWVAALFGNRHMAKCHQRVPRNLVESESNYGTPGPQKENSSSIIFTTSLCFCSCFRRRVHGRLRFENCFATALLFIWSLFLNLQTKTQG